MIPRVQIYANIYIFCPPPPGFRFPECFPENPSLILEFSCLLESKKMDRKRI